MSYSFAKQQMVIQATCVLKEIRYKNYRLFLLLTKLHIILKYKILPPPPLFYQVFLDQNQCTFLTREIM